MTKTTNKYMKTIVNYNNCTNPQIKELYLKEVETAFRNLDSNTKELLRLSGGDAEIMEIVWNN